MKNFFKNTWVKNEKNYPSDVLSINNTKLNLFENNGLLPTLSLDSDIYAYLPINQIILIRLKVSGELNPNFFDDPEFKIEISTKSNDATFTTKKWTSENGWILLTKVMKKNIGDLIIDVKVDGRNNGNIKIKFTESNDVFQSDKKDKLISELKYIKYFADNKIAPEYDENYCMQAAERSLSELLGDRVNFYSVERNTHKHRNGISFSGKNALLRGKYFESKGLVITTHFINKFQMNESKRKTLNESTSESQAYEAYENMMYEFVRLSNADKKYVENLFKSDLNKKELGFHIYYFTVTSGFHTLILIIDTISDPKNVKYEVWDQHGPSESSFGSLSVIGEGLRKQTSWTAANSCLNRYYTGKTKYFDSLDCTLWKIQRK